MSELREALLLRPGPYRKRPNQDHKAIVWPKAKKTLGREQSPTPGSCSEAILQRELDVAGALRAVEQPQCGTDARIRSI